LRQVVKETHEKIFDGGHFVLRGARERDVHWL
jgi:hypothetical protein